jgi:hypothetical protein
MDCKDTFWRLARPPRLFTLDFAVKAGPKRHVSAESDTRTGVIQRLVRGGFTRVLRYSVQANVKHGEAPAPGLDSFQD